MKSDENDDKQFSPALLLSLVVLLFVALKRDVFYDVLAQALAMLALALLLIAFVLPVTDLVEMCVSKWRWRKTVESSFRELSEPPGSPVPPMRKDETEEAPSSDQLPPHPRGERNAAPTGARLVHPVPAWNGNGGELKVRATISR